MRLSYSTIKNRLDQLGAQKRERADVSLAAKPGWRSLPCRLLETISDGEVHCGDSGRTLVRRLVLRPECGGASLPRELFERPGDDLSPEVLPHLSRDFDHGGDWLPASQVAYVDTETTGLMGGTGTVAFLIGVGWWEKTEFHLEQYVIEDYCHERDMLERITARLSQFSVLCTYNGRCYDVPLLRARSVIARLSPQFWQHRQLDLLHFSRRLWRDALPSVSLKMVEREILGIDRGPDIDGAEIPGVFAELCAKGDSPRLAEVLYHNVQDIASLAGLLGLLARVAADPLGSGLLRRREEFAAVGRWREAIRDLDGAGLAWKRALDTPGNVPSDADIQTRLALVHKRRRCWEDAIPLWEELALGPLRSGVAARIEMAKYHEHITRDFRQALDAVERAQRALRLQEEMVTWLEPSIETAEWLAAYSKDIEKRSERLRRKLRKA